MHIYARNVRRKKYANFFLGDPRISITIKILLSITITKIDIIL